MAGRSFSWRQWTAHLVAAHPVRERAHAACTHKVEAYLDRADATAVGRAIDLAWGVQRAGGGR